MIDSFPLVKKNIIMKHKRVTLASAGLIFNVTSFEDEIRFL